MRPTVDCLFDFLSLLSINQGKVYTMGENIDGQLGVNLNNKNRAEAPTLVDLPAKIEDVQLILDSMRAELRFGYFLQCQLSIWLGTKHLQLNQLSTKAELQISDFAVVFGVLPNCSG